MIKINVYYFITSLAIGLLLAYLLTPQPEVIIKYPTPENAGKIVYKDVNDVCYKYKANEVACPADKSKIVDNYLQDVDNNKLNKKFTLF